VAVPRAEREGQTRTPPPTTRGSGGASTTSASGGSESGNSGGSTTATVGGARERHGNPVVGRGVPRPPDNFPNRGGRFAHRYYYSPYYPPLYFGGGYWPGWWGGYGYTSYWDPFWRDYYYWHAQTSGYYGGGHRYDLGSVRLKYKPRDAEVYVDGYYVGVVDSFDGLFQRLRLEEGPHRIEIRARGHEPSFYDVRVLAGESITLEGELEQR
jgi:hypothetical protein